jgi:cytochrome b561
MLSAQRYPIVLAGAVHLPPILPHDAALYAMLRQTHTILAYALFATFIAHFGAALVHRQIYRDGVFASMSLSRRRAGPP